MGTINCDLSVAAARMYVDNSRGSEIFDGLSDSSSDIMVKSIDPSMIGEAFRFPMDWKPSLEATGPKDWTFCAETQLEKASSYRIELTIGNVIDIKSSGFFRSEKGSKPTASGPLIHLRPALCR